MVRKIKPCKYCSTNFTGDGSSIYCQELCRELAGVERRTGFRVDAEKRTCDGRCRPLATQRLMRKAKGWIFLTVREYYVKKGEKIKYCPYCSGELV